MGVGQALSLRGTPSPAWTSPTNPANAELRAPRGLGVRPALSPYFARLSSNSFGRVTYIEATKRAQGESAKTGIPRPHYTYQYQTVPRRPQGQQEPSDWTDSAAYSKKISPFVIFMLHSAARGSTLRLFKVFFQYSRSILDQVYRE